MQFLKILIACLHCKRKVHNQLIPHNSILNLHYQNKAVYYNIETDDTLAFAPLFAEIDKEQIHTDVWQFKSSWWKKPEFDQDQQRLVPICIARNMSIEAALGMNAEWLMFIDSDMTCPPDTLSKFIETANNYNRKVVFGEVKGRNNHKEAEYFFPGKYGSEAKNLGNNVWELHHGNIGFAVIHRSVFEKLRFRHGPHITDNSYQSDDPNFISDMVHSLGEDWPVLDRNIKATHIDEEILPFGSGAQY